MNRIVTIDGPAGAGKSSTARRVADRLGYRYLDTGALYRALALAVIRAGAENGTEEEMVRAASLPVVRAEWRGAKEMGVLLDGEDVTGLIRGVEVTRLVSPLSAIPGIRDLLIPLQREASVGNGIVVEGRDIGSVVFPDAPLKIFLIADPMERARRRRKDLERMGIDRTLEDVHREIVERDRRDSERAVAPLVRPEDAIDVDTTSLTLEEQVDRIVSLAREAGV